MNNWYCPECAGKHVRNFVFDHVRNGCSVGQSEDLIQYHDGQMLELWPHEYVRPSSMAERILVRVFVPDPGDDGEAETVVTRIAPGIIHRVVNGIDPDKMAAEQAAAS